MSVSRIIAVTFVIAVAAIDSSVVAQEQPRWNGAQSRVRPASHSSVETVPSVHRTETPIIRTGHERVAESTTETPGTIDLGPGPDFASQLPDDESQMIQIVEILQWTIVVLLVAVVAVIAIKKYSRGKLLPGQNSAIAYIATLPVKNHFQAHLLEIGSQKFLVTTDRSGVKTVNQINSWQDFDNQVNEASPQSI
jgi:hypothetical protein